MINYIILELKPMKKKSICHSYLYLMILVTGEKPAHIHIYT